MRPDHLYSLLTIVFLTLSSATLAAGEIYFAGDHYKVEGEPQIKAAPVNALLASGENVTLRLILSNSGGVVKLEPRDVPLGSESEASQEMLAEFACADAVNLEATLRSRGTIEVVSDTTQVQSLPSGEVALIEFDLTVREDAAGSYRLPLDLEYEYQIDVTVNGDHTSPLYLPIRKSLEVEVNVEGNAAAFRVVGTKSDISPGKKGSFVLAVENRRQSFARNCTAKLIASPPLTLEEGEVFLGDLGPGEVKVARVSVFAGEEAQTRDYLLTCEILHDEGSSTLSFVANVGDSDSGGMSILAVCLGAPFVLALFGGSILFVRRARSKRSRSLRKRRTSSLLRRT